MKQKTDKTKEIVVGGVEIAFDALCRCAPGGVVKMQRPIGSVLCSKTPLFPCKQAKNKQKNLGMCKLDEEKAVSCACMCGYDDASSA
jgi:hypothetical protein